MLTRTLPHDLVMGGDFRAGSQQKTIKLLEENIGKTLSNINHRTILYDLPPRVIEIKAKINKWDLIKLRCWEPAWEFPPMTKVMRRGLI